MNYLNGKCFLTLRNAGTAFLENVNGALLQYRTEKAKASETARKFKDEGEYLRNVLPPLKEKALSTITAAQKEFSDTIRVETASLKTQLQKHFQQPVNEKALTLIRTANEFSFPLSRTEVESFLKVNEGNPYGLRALRSTLEKGNSKYRVSFRDVTEYENDLSQLEQMAVNPIGYDTEYHPEMCDLFRDKSDTATRPDGSTYETGTPYTSTSLLMRRGVFEIAMDRLPTMADSWTADVGTPEIMTASEAMKKESETMNQTLRAEGVAESDLEPIPDPGESSVSVESSEGLELAREHGRRSSRSVDLSEYML